MEDELGLPCYAASSRIHSSSLGHVQETRYHLEMVYWSNDEDSYKVGNHPVPSMREVRHEYPSICFLGQQPKRSSVDPRKVPLEVEERLRDILLEICSTSAYKKMRV